MGVDEDEFNRFVVSRWPAFVRLAWLMTGEQRHAGEAVVAALVPVRADWERITSEEAPFAFTRAAVLAQVRSRKRDARIEQTRLALPRHAEPETDVFEDRPRDTADDPEQLEERRLQVRRALLQLPSRTRAVTLLRHAEQLTDGEVAGVLEIAPALVFGDEARGVGALHAALKDLPRGDGDPQLVVRAALADVLESAPDAPLDPLARIERVGREQRRKRSIVTGAIAAVLVAAFAIPAAFGAYDTEPDPAPSSSATIDAAVWDDPFTWPTRGSLSDDTTFLAEMKQAHGSTNTLYAGVVEDRTVVALWNRATNTIEGYQGPVDVGARELEPAGGVSEYGSVFGSDAAFSIAVTNLTRGTMIILGTPELGPVEVSRSVQIYPNGGFNRDWVTVPTRDGMATAALESASTGLLRAQTADGRVPLEVLAVTSEEQTLLVDCLKCQSDDPAVSFAARTNYEVSRLLNLPTDALTTTVRYQGSVDARVAGLPDSAADPEISEDAANADLVVVHTRLPNGAVLRGAQITSTNSRDEGYVLYLEQFVPIDARTVDDPFTLSGDPQGDSVDLQVFARGSASLAVLEPGSPALVPKQAVRDGSALVDLPTPTPSNLALETYDREGRTLGKWPLTELELATRESLVQ